VGERLPLPGEVDRVDDDVDMRVLKDLLQLVLVLVLW